jgi:hypothetical protein
MKKFVALNRRHGSNGGCASGLISELLHVSPKRTVTVIRRGAAPILTLEILQFDKTNTLENARLEDQKMADIATERFRLHVCQQTISEKRRALAFQFSPPGSATRRWVSRRNKNGRPQQKPPPAPWQQIGSKLTDSKVEGGILVPVLIGYSWKNWALSRLGFENASDLDRRLWGEAVTRLPNRGPRED